MAIDKQAIDQLAELFVAVRASLDWHESPEGKSGVACAKGALTARTNELKIIAVALETREPKPADRQTVQLARQTVTWLMTDLYVTKDFIGADLPVNETTLANAYPTIVFSGPLLFGQSMEMIAKVIDALTDEGAQPAP